MHIYTVMRLKLDARIAILLSLLTLVLCICGVTVHAATATYSTFLLFNMTQVSTKKSTLLFVNTSLVPVSIYSSLKTLSIPLPIYRIYMDLNFTRAVYTRDGYTVHLEVYSERGFVSIPEYLYEIYVGNLTQFDITLKASVPDNIAEFLTSEEAVVYVSAIKLNSLSDLKNFVSDIVNLGNVSDIYKQLASNIVLRDVSLSALQSGVTLSLGTNVGTGYLIIIWANCTKQPVKTFVILNLVFVKPVKTSHVVQVELNATSAIVGSMLNVTAKIPSGMTGDLVVVMIYSTKYPLPLSVRSPGKVTDTQILVYGVNIVTPRVTATERYFTLFGIGLAGVTSSVIEQKVLQIIGKTYSTVAYTPLTRPYTTVLIPTRGLYYGKYVVLVFAWNPENKTVYYVDYRSFTVLPPRPAPATPPPPPPPVIVPRPVIVNKTTLTYSIGRYLYITPTAGVTLGTTATINATSKDREVTISIPKFTVPLVQGKPTHILKVSVKAKNVTEVKLPSNIKPVVKKAYVISTYPPNVTFSKPVKVVFKIGHVPGKVYVLYYNKTLGKWIPLPTNITKGKAVAEITKPGIVTVGEYTPPKVTNVVSVSLTLSTTTVTACEPVKITVRVSVSTGSPSGKIVMLYVNGRYIAYRITGSSGVVTFTYRTCNIGIFNIYAVVDGKRSNTATLFVYPILG